MSTLIVANVHLEATANNRIQYGGSNNFTIFAGGVQVASVNSTVMSVNGIFQTSNVVVNAKTDNYTLTSADSGTVITMTNTAVKTVTIPAGLPVGYRCMIYQLGSANVTIGNAAGVTLNSRSGGYTCYNQYGSISLMSHSANSYIIDGVV
jgi:hypothetical protein